MLGRATIRVIKIFILGNSRHCGSIICDVLRDLISFVHFKKRENIHGGVLLLVKLESKNLQLY